MPIDNYIALNQLQMNAEFLWVTSKNIYQIIGIDFRQTKTLFANSKTREIESPHYCD